MFEGGVVLSFRGCVHATVQCQNQKKKHLSWAVYTSARSPARTRTSARQKTLEMTHFRAQLKWKVQPKYKLHFPKTFLLTCLVVAVSLDFGTFAVPTVLTVALPGRLSAPVALRSWKRQMPFLQMPLNASSAPWSSRLDVAFSPF